MGERTQRQISRQLEREEAQKIKYYTASQFELMWWRFKKHRAALAGAAIYGFFIFLALFAEFLAPTTRHYRDPEYRTGPPQKLHFIDEDGVFHLRPFIYPVKTALDPETFDFEVVEDTAPRLPLHFFVRGEPYEFWGLIRSDLHLFGVQEGDIHLLGTDNLGRDLLSRILYATRVSLSIGIVGMLISFAMGLTIGGTAGFFGGAVDTVIQRFSEFIRALPHYPIWMAVAAAMPKHWTPQQVYFLITLALGLLSWTTLARRIRGQILSVRNDDYVISARISGCSSRRIIVRHMLPTFLSYIIVDLTVSFPYVILGETSLSFLGLGLQPPVVSWGVLLSSAQQLKTIAMYAWLLTPAVPLILTVLSVNLLGDGLRDAADPYAR